MEVSGWKETDDDIFRRHKPSYVIKIEETCTVVGAGDWSSGCGFWDWNPAIYLGSQRVNFRLGYAIWRQTKCCHVKKMFFLFYCNTFKFTFTG
ncbi:hypothetical protein AVEN_52027-1 [Araneus ventricosus]|uniref:Uncharacterized protein n=1 Tax=Araneus ventricosus TaxID=182803 RepID=A0A4Y2CF50_ARAVE|nr:hypothetical protein AVEN_52027-1 [Araneus ventricosus]